MVPWILVTKNDLDEKKFLKREGLGEKGVWALSVPEKGIKISELRTWLKRYYLSIKKDDLMVFWINGADCLSEQCQNVLLKPLEESKKEVLFVLAVESEFRLLPTIISRCDVKKMETRLRTSLPAGRQGFDEAKWEELVEAWKLGSGATIGLLDKWQKDNEFEILDSFINILAKGLRKLPSKRRVKILKLALELKKDSREMINGKLMLGRFLLEGGRVSGLASSALI